MIRLPKTLLIIVTLVGLHISGVGFAGVVAKGDGVEITTDFVSTVKGFYEENTNFSTTEEGYTEIAIKIRLFAKEAKRLGLGEQEADDSDQSAFDVEMALADDYFKHILDGYKVDNKVIESYQKANYEDFQEYDEEAGEYILTPISDEIRDDIRKRIVSAKAMKIGEDEVELLKKKFNLKKLNDD